MPDREFKEAREKSPKGSDMFEHLRTRLPEGKAILLRPPGSYGFIELTREQYNGAIDEFERLATIGIALGEKASPLQRIGIMMLLGWDYDHFAKDHLAPKD